MISISGLTFHFGGRTLYDEADLHIKPKDRIGLIGLNGTGKSTLLRLIVGEYRPDGGSISMAKDVTIGFLNQDLLSYQTHDSILLVAMQAFDRQMELQRKIDEILHKMETEYTDELVNKLAKLQEEFDSLDGYTIQAKAEEILEGLGFTTEELHQPLHTFSGGWRMRVMLAKILLQKPSLLLLDEPTNHLDLPSIKWLENYLNSYEGAVIIVSHDRFFLDRTVSSIVEVTQQQLIQYSGNYSFYMEEKAMRSEIQQAAFENQQQKIKQEERFIERFKAKASKATQAKSRQKALDRMERIEEVAPEAARVNFRFRFSQQPGRHILRLEHVHKRFGDKVIFRDSHATIERGDKIALIGANGKGKSTLLRIIAGTEPIEGKHQLGHNVQLGFFAQHQLEALNVENEMLQELVQAGSGKTEMELRTVLGCFLFSGDDVFKKIKVLSGGEKSRVALAKTLISEANFLMLDEPTNHLDMQSVNILIQALEQYEGTFVVISHDRYFVENVANKIWYIEDHQLKEYPGTYAEYELFLEERGKNKPAPSAPVQTSKPKQENKAAGTNNSAIAQQLKHGKKQLEDLENRISLLEQEKVKWEEKLGDTAIYANPDKLQEANNAFAKVEKDLQKLQEDWEELMMALEDLENQVKG